MYKNPGKAIIISACEQSRGGEQISEGDVTSVAQYSCTTACHSTAALLQTGTSILHRNLLSVRYLSGLCFSGEHETNIDRAEY